MLTLVNQMFLGPFFDIQANQQTPHPYEQTLLCQKQS